MRVSFLILARRDAWPRAANRHRFEEVGPPGVTLSATRVERRAKSLSAGPTERSFVARSTTRLLRMTAVFLG
jgi:hypothetical protein